MSAPLDITTFSKDQILSCLLLNTHKSDKDDTETDFEKQIFDNLDYETIIELLDASDSTTDPAIQNKIGEMYYNGNNVIKSHRLAFEWFYKAADKGNIAGLKNLGKMYERGHGTPMSKSRAMFCYFQAFEQGDVVAMNYLGAIFKFDGDLHQALIWYKRAMDKGHKPAKYEAEKLYRQRIWLNYNDHALLSVEKKAASLELSTEKLSKCSGDNEKKLKNIMDTLEQSNKNNTKLLDRIEQLIEENEKLKIRIISLEHKVNPNSDNPS